MPEFLRCGSVFSLSMHIDICVYHAYSRGKDEDTLMQWLVMCLELRRLGLEGANIVPRVTEISLVC